MSDTPDYSQSADVFQKAMEEALANIDLVNANLQKEQEKAIDMQIAARNELNRILNEADKIAETRIEERRKANLEQLRNEVWAETVEKLIVEEIPSNMLKRILNLPVKLLADIWLKLGFEKLDESHVANVGYANEGRTGYVIFYRNDLTVRFFFEFGGGDTVAIITIPTPDRWEAETKIPLSDRQTVLEFIAKRVIRDQASGCRYFIGESDILIQH